MGDFILRAFDYIVTISFGYILHCVCFNLCCGGFILFCNVCVCVCVCVCVRMCGFCNVWVFWYYVYCTLTEIFLTLTEVFPCIFLSCKANARVKTRKDGARSALFHISCYLCCSVVICVVLYTVCA